MLRLRAADAAHHESTGPRDCTGQDLMPKMSTTWALEASRRNYTAQVEKRSETSPPRSLGTGSLQRHCEPCIHARWTRSNSSDPARLRD